MHKWNAQQNVEHCFYLEMFTKKSKFFLDLSTFIASELNSLSKTSLRWDVDELDLPSLLTNFALDGSLVIDMKK